MRIRIFALVLALLFSGELRTAAPPLAAAENVLISKSPEGVIFGNGIQWSANEPWNTLENRRNFLVGMYVGSPFLVPDDSGFETFWPTETRAANVYRTVAKLYAADIGVKPEKLATEEWRGSVAESLRPFQGNTGAGDLKQELAWLAGVYARHGTPTGFRFSGRDRGYEIGKMMSRLGMFEVQLVTVSGYPGGSTLTIVGNEENPVAGFFTLMSWIEAGVQKPAVPTTSPREAGK